jgi:hypothetical protein
MTPMEYFEMQQSLVKDINLILTKYDIDRSIDPSDITITDTTVSDLVKENKAFSNSIVDSIWPSIDVLTVYHYTPKEAAESILNNGEFRLYSLLKRFHDDEIITFCNNHELWGYLKSENGVPKYKSLIMDNIYYASFADTNLTTKQEECLWSRFAPGDGVRLKLEVTASNPNFRKMIYEVTKGEPISLLKELSEKLKNSYNREFILSGISRMYVIRESWVFKSL